PMSFVLRGQPSVWTAPLVPVALAMTAGIALDRTCVIPLLASLGAALASMLAWIIFSRSPQKWLALIYLWGGVAALGASCHHWHRHRLDPDDVSHYASLEGQPARLRGTLTSAPIAQPAPAVDTLRSIPGKAISRLVVRVIERQDMTTRNWSPVCGLVQVSM